MKLQKLMLAIAAVGALTACSNSEENGIDNSWLANAPGTEVYMGVDALNNLTKVGTSSRAARFSGSVIILGDLTICHKSVSLRYATQTSRL